jgi:hypothetical protein
VAKILLLQRFRILKSLWVLIVSTVYRILPLPSCLFFCAHLNTFASFLFRVISDLLVDFDLFLRILNRPDGFRAPGQPEDFVRGFQVFDKDGTGFIGVGELKYGKAPLLCLQNVLNIVASSYESRREIN